MKKKAFVLAFLLATGSASAAPGLLTPGRTAALNVFPNLGSSILLTPLRSARTVRAARADRFADAVASNNGAMALANADAGGLPGLEALRERAANRADRPALLSDIGKGDGNSSFDFDSSTKTNSDGSLSRTYTTAFERETDGSRTTKVLFDEADASRTVDAKSKSKLDTSFTLNGEREPVAAPGRALKIGKVEMAVNYNRDASRSTKIDGTASSDRETSTSRKTDYSGKFDSSRPFDGKAFDVTYRSELTPPNGETVVRSSDSAANTPAAARPQLSERVKDNAAQRQENRQARRDERQGLAGEQLRETAQKNAEQRQANREERLQNGQQALSSDQLREQAQANAEQRQKNREDRQNERQGLAGEQLRETAQKNAEQRQANREERLQNGQQALSSDQLREQAQANAEQRQKNREDRQSERQGLALEQLKETAEKNAAERKENRENRREDRVQLASADQLRERAQDNAAQRQENRQDRREERQDLAGQQLIETAQKNAAERQQNRADRREERMNNN